MKTRFTQIPAWFTWSDQATNLRVQARAYSYARRPYSGDPLVDYENWLAYNVYTDKGYSIP
jgi:hypothetical protein